jgi:hypothetical protein
MEELLVCQMSSGVGCRFLAEPLVDVPTDVVNLLGTGAEYQDVNGIGSIPGCGGVDS